MIDPVKKYNWDEHKFRTDILITIKTGQMLVTSALLKVLYTLVGYGDYSTFTVRVQGERLYDEKGIIPQ